MTRGIDIVEFACGIPQLLRRLHRPGQHRHRQLDAAPAAGRGGRHHAVQLPLHGAVLDVPGGHRLRQRLHPQNPANATLPPRCSSPRTCSNRPACPTASSTSCRATSWRWTRCSRTRREGAQLRRLDADRAVHLRDRRAPRQARAGAGGAKNHMVVMPDADHRTGGGRADRRGLRLGRRTLHGHQRGGAGGRHRRPDHPELAERARTLKVKNGMELDAEMGPIVTREAKERIEGYIALGERRKAPSSSSTAAA